MRTSMLVAVLASLVFLASCATPPSDTQASRATWDIPEEKISTLTLKITKRYAYTFSHHFEATVTQVSGGAFPNNAKQVAVAFTSVRDWPWGLGDTVTIRVGPVDRDKAQGPDWVILDDLPGTPILSIKKDKKS